MQRNRFLTDMLSTLFDRRNTAIPANDKRDIYQLCSALLSEEGDVSGQKLAAGVLARYRSLSDDEKAAFFTYLNDDLDIDATALAPLAEQYAKAPTHDLFAALSRAAEPKRQELLRRLKRPPGETEALVGMRADLLRYRKHEIRYLR